MPFPSEQLLATRPTRTRAADPAEEAAPRSLREFVDDVRAAARFAADFGAELARSPLAHDLDGSQISEVGQTLFELDTIRRGELKDHVTLRRLRQADRALELRTLSLDLSRERFAACWRRGRRWTTSACPTSSGNSTPCANCPTLKGWRST